jgi:hypothetical protein
MMDKKHILLIGHPEGYYQFIDFLLSKNYKITWVPTPTCTNLSRCHEDVEVISRNI